MADILLMNPIIAAISSVRRGVPLKRRGGGRGRRRRAEHLSV